MRQYLQALSEGVRDARPWYIREAVSRMVDLRRDSNSASWSREQSPLPVNSPALLRLTEGR